jgi:hypothetical protein
MGMIRLRGKAIGTKVLGRSSPRFSYFLQKRFRVTFHLRVTIAFNYYK